MATPQTIYPTLRSGSKGFSVKNLQITLNTWAGLYKREDFYTGTPDGVFGPKTKSAVMAFQAALDLPADGIVGPNTWDAIQKTGEAIIAQRAIYFKPAVKSTEPKMTAEALKPSKIPPPAGGFDIAGMFGSLDWKLVGAAIALGTGLLIVMAKRKRK